MNDKAYRIMHLVAAGLAFAVLCIVLYCDLSHHQETRTPHVLGAGTQSPITVDTAANRPTAGVRGRLHFATDTGVISVDNGSSWVTASLGLGTVQSGACNSRPTATGSNRLYFCNDAPLSYLDTGQWTQFGNLGATSQPLAVANYTIAPAGSISLVQVGDSLRASQTTRGSNATANGAFFPTGFLGGATTWYVTLAATYLAQNPNTQFPGFGVTVSNGITSSDTAYTMYVLQNANASLGFVYETVHPQGGRISFANYISDGVFNPQSGGTGLFWLRIFNDGTVTHFQISNEGTFWIDWYSITAPSDLANYGFLLGDGNGTGTTGASLLVEQNTFSTNIPVTQATVTGASNTNPITITTAAPHLLNSGDLVSIAGVGGNTAANTGTGSGTAGFFPIQVTDSTHFKLNGVSGNGAYSGGGVVTCISR